MQGMNVGPFISKLITISASRVLIDHFFPDKGK